MTVAENVDANASFYTWSVPANYALKLGASPNISYTCLLTIQADNGSSNTSSFVSVSAAASSPAVAKRDVAAFAATLKRLLSVLSLLLVPQLLSWCIYI